MTSNSRDFSYQTSLVRSLIMAGRTASHLVSTFVREKNLGYGAVEVLCLLWEDEGIGLTHSQISRNLGVDQSSAYRSISRLEEKGFVVRVSGPSEGRSKTVVGLTDRGAALRDEIMALLIDVESLQSSKFPSEEVEDLKVNLASLALSAEAAWRGKVIEQDTLVARRRIEELGQETEAA